MVMRLRKEYEIKGLYVDDSDIIVDSQDSFSFRTPVGIIGFNRNEEQFWRNQVEVPKVSEMGEGKDD